MRPYPVIDPRATGENILRRRRELGYSVLDVQKYLKKQQQQNDEPVNNAFAQALAGLKLDK